MVWALGFILTVIVVAYVGFPLFVREAPAEEDALELAIAQRRASKKTGSVARGMASQQGKVACGSCGAPNLPGDRFCARCGAPMGTRCPSCGTPYDSGDLFCAGCGARLAGRQ